MIKKNNFPQKGCLNVVVHFMEINFHDLLAHVLSLTKNRHLLSLHLTLTSLSYCQTHFHDCINYCNNPWKWLTK